MFELDISHINVKEYSKEADRFISNQESYGNGFYLSAPKDSREYKEYWDLQEYYCKNGFSVGGVKITGEHYFYLNFCQIHLKDSFFTENVIKQKKAIEKRTTFPAFWDSDWYYFTESALAKEAGQHMIILKPRRRGYSFKNGAKVAWNYTFIRKSTSLILAGLKEYGEETMGMAVDYLDFLDKYTDFSHPRLVDRRSEVVQSGWTEITPDNRKVTLGYKSRIMQFSTKVTPSIARGKDANVILFEEAGSFGNLLATYKATRATVEEGLDVTGMIYAFGCVCKGTKVWTNNGKLINIEDIQVSDGILGYDGKGIYKEIIGGLKPPEQKECYRIETTGGNFIECSYDHPLLWSKPKYRVDRGNKGVFKKVTFKEAQLIQKGDQLMMIKEVPVFGIISHPEARVIGLLIGDGNYTKGATPQLSVSDDAIFKYIDANQEVTVYKHFRTDSNIDYKSVGIKNFKTQLTKHGIYGQVKLDKRLPNNLELWDEKSICELIAGYYDADGNVYYNEKKKSIRVVLTSICKPLLTEVKYQLLKLGIRSSIVKENRGSMAKKLSAGQLDHIYRLYINTNEDVKIFKAKIKLLSTHKQNVLNKINGLNSYGHYNPKQVEYELNVDLKKGSFFIGQKDMKNMSFVTVTKVEPIGFQDIYNLHTTHTNTYISNGFITKQTGGDFSGAQVDFEEMFNNPEAYNFRTYQNIFDDGKQHTTIGYFLPDYYSKGGFITEQGLSKTTEADTYIEGHLQFLKTTAKDPNAVDAYLAEFPRKPQEGFIKTGTNILPKAEINQQINRINTEKALQFLGTNCKIYQNEKGTTICEPNDDAKPILHFPLKKDVDGEGCIIRYQLPYEESSKVPSNLYYICTDPYAIDKGEDKQLTKRDSLGASYVIKRINNVSKPYDIIVCEYVARPKFQDDYNRTLFLLADYYNAKIVFENDRDGNIISYAKTNNLLHRLEEELTVYDSNDSPKVKLGRRYGVSMSNREVKRQALQYLRDWLLSPREVDEKGNFELNIHKIYSVPLLEEMLKFDFDGNFDRISSFLVAMLYKKELLLKPSFEAGQKSIYDDEFFTRFDFNLV